MLGFGEPPPLDAFAGRLALASNLLDRSGIVVLGNSDLADTVGVAHLPSIFTDSRVLGVVRNHAGRFSNSSGFAA